ncbi:unnamed protein product [Cylicostephanus goldi]|uniref:Uncharacterized protein n=1 Tax=Cylicostephanus goldi TaxID=71465 RepID=A0A3P7MEN7_CYLGO|nr:unnamed protein product [Cylicostephanus goldi]
MRKLPNPCIVYIKLQITSHVSGINQNVDKVVSQGAYQTNGFAMDIRTAIMGRMKLIVMVMPGLLATMHAVQESIGIPLRLYVYPENRAFILHEG